MTALRVQHEVTTSPLHSAHATSPWSMFDPVVRELKKCQLRTFCKLYRDCWEKVIMKAAEATAKRLEKRTWTVPSARVWLLQRSGLSQQKQNTLEGSSKKRIMSMRWTMDDRLVRNTSSVILSKTWNLNKPLWREAVVFTIQTAGNSLKRNARLESGIILTKLPEETNFCAEAKSKYRDGPRKDWCRANERWGSHREDDLRHFDAKTIHTI